MDGLVIAIDPGKRIGVAWVAGDGRLVRHEVVDAATLASYAFPSEARVVVGDGTGSAAISDGLRDRGVVHELVDEYGTSEEARELYWRDHPPRGWWRLVPLGLRPPPRSLDDYAAYAIALRARSTRPHDRRSRTHGASKRSSGRS
ncbi:hypothetical protein BH23DEI1_BH23DEI1_01650 [soil metagenome]